MLQVSSFELLIKPIAPRDVLPLPLQAVARRIVQGYFLTISNLEDRDFTFRIEFIDSKPTPPNPSRQLSVNPRNVNLLLDIAGANQDLLGPALQFIGGNFGSSFTLPARQTASVQLLPALAPFIPGLGSTTPLPSPVTNPNPDLEIRGFVELRLPPRFRFVPGQGLSVTPQSETPVKVLLQPEIRGTFLPNDFPTTPLGDFDQINYSLVTASGKALNEIEPEGLTALTINPTVVNSVIDSLQTNGINPNTLLTSEVARVQEMVEFFAQIDPNSESLERLSELLSKVNIPIKVNRI